MLRKSNRYKYGKHIPKYVQKFNLPSSKNRWRVCKKLNGKVITYGYTKTMKQAVRVKELFNLED